MNRMTSARASWLAAAVGGLVVIGAAFLLLRGDSGPMSRDAYATELAAAASAFSAPPSDLRSANGLEQAARSYDDLAARLDGARPPADAAQAHRRLVGGLRAYAADLRAAATAVPRGRAAVEDALGRAGASVATWTEAFTELAQLGYATSAP
jgi:hypothetical protein